MKQSIQWSLATLVLLLAYSATGLAQHWQSREAKDASVVEGKDFESHVPAAFQAMRKQAATGVLGPAVRYDYSVTTPMPDLSTTDIPIAVAGFAGAVGKVVVSLHLDHTFDSDLDIYLIAPDATVIELSTDNGGSGDNYGLGCSPDADRTTFDDDAATSIVGQFAPLAGSFQPEQALSGFAGKFGAAVNGNWTLRIIDDAGLDVGTFYCASLFLSPMTGFMTVSSALSDGNLNGFVDPNECSTFGVSLRNVGGSALTGITGTLSSTTPGVVITQATSAFPDASSLSVVTNTTPFGIGTTPSFVCGTPVVLTLALSYNGGSENETYTLYAGSEEFVNSTTTALADLSTTDIPISVSGFTGTLSAMTVSVHLEHTWDNDLQISLISPDNTEVMLSNRNGGNGDNYGTGCGNPTVFDDNATTPIAAGGAPFAGRFIPDAPLSGFYGKSGSQVNGTWTLRIVDNAGFDVGTFYCATLTLGPICSDGGSLPPSITVALDPDELWPPNHTMRAIEAMVATQGGCGAVTYVLDAIMSSEPDNGLGDGDTADDIQNELTGTPDLFFNLRAERSGTGTGRVYTATYTATDQIGNFSSGSGTVTVPHSRSGAPADQTGPAGEAQAELQNFPNPFNPATRLTFQVRERSSVTITVTDMLGREIERLASGTYDAGSHSLDCDASQLPSGMYFARLRVSSVADGSVRVVTQKMVLSK